MEAESSEQKVAVPVVITSEEAFPRLSDELKAPTADRRFPSTGARRTGRACYAQSPSPPGDVDDGAPSHSQDQFACRKE